MTMTSDQAHSATACIRIWKGEVLPEWLDYNGHMTEHRYLQAFGESSDALYGLLGVDFADAQSGAFYTLTTHIHHLAECKVGTPLWSETEILGHDEKRIHLFHRLFDTDGKLLATGEHLAIHVRASKACAAPVDMLEKLATLYSGRSGLPMPEGTGSVLKRPLVNARSTALRPCPP
jgi:acyl-CoA thioester hydrolase